jgi:hypothetical protein
MSWLTDWDQAAQRPWLTRTFLFVGFSAVMTGIAAITGELSELPVLSAAIALLAGAASTAVTEPLTTGRVRPSKPSGRVRIQFRVEYFALAAIAVVLAFVTSSPLIAYALVLVGSIYLGVRAVAARGD